MPNHIVSGNVDTMMRAADNAAIRSAIGVGTTDAPTFLAQTLTGQSLTGTQATSLVDLATTWNTSGTPTAIKLNVVETGVGSNAASRLLDLQIGLTSRMRVGREGGVFSQNSSDTGGLFSAGSNGFKTIQFGGSLFTSNGLAAIRDPGLVAVRDAGGFCWVDASQNPATGPIELSLFKDAAGILAQRNGTSPQAFRVYNSTDATPATNFDRASFGFTTNTLRIGTENGGTYTTARPIDFVTGGVARWQISAAGHFLAATDNAYDIGASGANRPRNIYAGTSFLLPFNGSLLIESRLNLSCPTNGRLLLANSTANDFDRLQLGGTTTAFPAIKRNGTGIDIKLADDSAFAPVKGKLTTDTNYTAGVPSATGYLTIYDATGTAYRVPCTV